MQSLLTDFYELTMANGFYNQGRKDEIAYFDYFFRRIPDEGGYAIFAGLAQILDYLNQLKFNENEIEFLRKKALFSDEFLNYLKDFRFTGDVYSVTEGTVVFPNEPLLTIRAPLIECQIIETFILLTLNHQCRIATKAGRIVRSAKGRPVYEFGARRAHGADASLYGARASYIAGITATSNTYAHYTLGIPVSGTMAHAYVQSFPSEYEAFLSYAQNYPDNTVLLVDTYHVLQKGIPNAIRVHNEYLKPNGYELKGIRIDSGDLCYLSNQARQLLDEAGLDNTKIVVSNSLDEYLIKDLLIHDAKIDGFGVGECLITAKSDPVFGGVYKIVALEQNNQIIPKIKISETLSKTTTPHFKSLWRLYDKDTQKAIADVIALHDEIIDESQPYLLFDPEAPWNKKWVQNFIAKPLLEKYLENGKKIKSLPSLAESRDYCQQELKSLWAEVKRLEHPQKYFVDLSQKLWQLKQDLLHQYSGQ